MSAPDILKIAEGIVISLIFMSACSAEPVRPIVPPSLPGENQLGEAQPQSPHNLPSAAVSSDNATRDSIIPSAVITSGVTGYEIGDTAPDFALSTPEGRDFSLSEFRGVTVLLHFWDIGCPKCVAEMPIFQEVWDDHHQTGDLAILAVNLGGDAEQVTNFMKGYGYTFTALLDSDRVVNRLYDEPCCPGTYVINREGIISYKLEGVFNDKTEIEYVARK